MSGVKFRGVEGRDVYRDGRAGFNIHIITRGTNESGAKFRSRVATAMRFPLTANDTEVTDVSLVEEDVGPLTMTNRYEAVVWVPSEGLKSAGVGSSLDFLLDELNDRVIDPVTGKIMEP